MQVANGFLNDLSKPLHHHRHQNGTFMALSPSIRSFYGISDSWQLFFQAADAFLVFFGGQQQAHVRGALGRYITISEDNWNTLV